MIRVRSPVCPQTLQVGEATTEVTAERDGHVRSAKRRHDLKASLPEDVDR